jgi:hypothetical protein
MNLDADPGFSMERHRILQVTEEDHYLQFHLQHKWSTKPPGYQAQSRKQDD